MADIAIETNSHTFVHIMSQRGGVFWTAPLVGYVFYLDSSGNLVWRKTVDGGATWSAADTIIPAIVTTYDCWADWQTAGNSGTKIHIAAAETATDTIMYAYLDTSNDSEGTDTVEAAQGDGTIVITAGRNINQISITKTRGGNLAVVAHYRDTAGVTFYIFYTSPDGDIWTSKSSPLESDYLDHFLLFPANLADNQDLWCAFWDSSANEISLKTFDNSANDWTSIAEASIASSMTENTSYIQMDGAIRLSDGHLIFAAWNLYDNAAADLMVWDITNASTITAKTNVITNEAETFLVSVFIDQNTGDIYVTYVSGSAAQATVAVFYQKSTDGGANWGVETAMQADAEDDERWVSAGAVKVAWGGKFQPVWFNDDLNDIYCNTTNGISIAAVSGWAGELYGLSVTEVYGLVPAEVNGL